MNLDWDKPIIMRWREGKAGGGKGGMYSERSFTIATGNDQVLIIDGTRVDDVRVYEDGIVPTVISRYGTGGGNVPMIFDNSEATAFSVREDAKANNFSATETDTALTLQSHQPSPQSHHAQLFLAQTSTVRRLTPTECERLQGFPDGWTEGQADSNRYKQMGNAVAVPVVEWIIKSMIEVIG